MYTFSVLCGAGRENRENPGRRSLAGGGLDQVHTADCTAPDQIYRQQDVRTVSS